MKINIQSFLFACAVLFAASLISVGQEAGNRLDGDRLARQPRPPGQINLLRELGLSQEQVRKMRQLNADARPIRERAQLRLREANQALDLAIYADTIDDAEFTARLKECQDAQNEFARLRFLGELAVRRILSPEQLTKFRELRRRAAAASQENFRQARPLRRGVTRQPDPSDDRQLF